MRDNEIPFSNEEYKNNLTLQEAIELLNDCGTNINSQQEPTVLELLNKALDKLETLETLLDIKKLTFMIGSDAVEA